jgi:hypothetical protein
MAVIDFNQYATPAQAQPAVAAAAPAGPIDFSRYTEPAQPQGTVERYARSFNQVVTGAQDPSELYDNLSKEVQNTNFSLSPAEGAMPMFKGLYQGMEDTWQLAEKEWKQGNYTTAAGLMNKADAVIHGIASGVPYFGPMFAKASTQASQGDYAGAAGTMTGAFGPALASATIPAAQTGTVITPEGAAQTGAVKQLAQQYPKAVTRTATVVGGGVGAALGHATGIPYAGEFGTAVGGAIGRVAGERFSAPTPVPEAPTPAAIDITPSWPGREPIPAAAYLAYRRQGLNDYDAYQSALEDYRAQKGAQTEARAAAPVSQPAPAPAEAAPTPTPAPAAPAPATGAPPAAAPTAPATLTEQLKASLAQTPEAAAEKPAAPAPPSTAAPVAPEITNLRNSVESFVESEVPFDQFPALNRRTVAQVDHALSQGDVPKAQKWLDDAYDKMNVSPDDLTTEQRQNAMETDDWARTHAAQGRNQYVGKKMLAQRNRVETQPKLADSYRDAVSKFLEQNAPQPVPAAQ